MLLLEKKAPPQYTQRTPADRHFNNLECQRHRADYVRANMADKYALITTTNKNGNGCVWQRCRKTMVAYIFAWSTTQRSLVKIERNLYFFFCILLQAIAVNGLWDENACCIWTIDDINWRIHSCSTSPGTLEAFFSVVVLRIIIIIILC